MRRTFEPAERRGDGRSLGARVLVAVSLLVASLLASTLTAPAAGALGASPDPVAGCVSGSHVAGYAYHYGLNDPLRYADPSGASAEVGRGGVSDAALVAGSWPDGIVDGLASLPGLLGDNLSSLLDTGAALLGDCRLLPKVTWRPAMGPDVGCIAGNAGELISSALDGLLASIDEVVNAGSGPQAALAALSAVMGFDLGGCYEKGWQYCIAKGAVPFLAEALITGGTGKIASSVAKVLDHLPTPKVPGSGHGHTGTPHRTRGTPSGGPDYVTARPDFSPTPNRGGAPGSRPGEPFTQAGKDEVLQRQAAAQADGIARCANSSCQVRLTKPLKSERGVTPPRTDAQVDHIYPRSRGGSGDPSNGQGLCRVCNREKWDEW